MPALQLLLGRGKKLFEIDAREWGLSRRQAFSIALLPILLVGVMVVISILAVVAKTPFRPVFRFITAEDSVFEWLQFCFVFVSSLL
ncbi:MAG TPA: hypothetical protein VFX76_21170, partial [Roseiflexaceae bacterium]|nr:hypothetical protein [Roseiflexaceae bacterium]